MMPKSIQQYRWEQQVAAATAAAMAPRAAGPLMAQPLPPLPQAPNSMASGGRGFMGGLGAMGGMGGEPDTQSVIANEL
eukprot:1380019-Amorphochlora_amoeboformis.AAC.1